MTTRWVFQQGTSSFSFHTVASILTWFNDGVPSSNVLNTGRRWLDPVMHGQSHERGQGRIGCVYYYIYRAQSKHPCHKQIPGRAPRPSTIALFSSQYILLIVYHLYIVGKSVTNKHNTVYWLSVFFFFKFVHIMFVRQYVFVSLPLQCVSDPRVRNQASVYWELVPQVSIRLRALLKAWLSMESALISRRPTIYRWAIYLRWTRCISHSDLKQVMDCAT